MDKLLSPYIYAYILEKLIDLLACRENTKSKGRALVCLHFISKNYHLSTVVEDKRSEILFSFLQSSSLSYIHIKHIGMLTCIQKRTGNKLMIFPSCLHIAKRMAYFACVGCRNLLSEKTLELRPFH